MSGEFKIVVTDTDPRPDHLPGYPYDRLEVVSFHGGAARGPCLQFNQVAEYIQLDADRVFDFLRRRLGEWLNDVRPDLLLADIPESWNPHGDAKG